MTDEEWEDRCTCCDNTGITIQTERRCACQPPLTPTPSPVDWNVVGPKLVEALREIVDQCPATCETSDAHTMADIAREALANQRSSVDLNAVAKDAAERAGKNASVAPQLLFAHILWALQDAFPALAAAQPGAGE